MEKHLNCSSVRMLSVVFVMGECFLKASCLEKDFILFYFCDATAREEKLVPMLHVRYARDGASKSL